MFVEQAHSTKCFMASRARILFGLQMSLQMSSEIGLVRKAPGTISTSKGFFTGMCANVALQQPRSGETFATNVTLAWQSMGTNMHLEGGQGGVAFGTEFTGKSLGDLICTMELQMFGMS